MRSFALPVQACLAHDAVRQSLLLTRQLRTQSRARRWHAFLRPAVCPRLRNRAPTLDVARQWWPVDKGGVSDVIDADRSLKWFGLRWENIDENLVLRYTPSKTSGTTGKTVIYPLSKAPMIIEELEHWPHEQRIGPVIDSEATTCRT